MLIQNSSVVGDGDRKLSRKQAPATSAPIAKHAELTYLSFERF